MYWSIYKIMATANNMPPGLSRTMDPVFVQYLVDQVVSSINLTDTEKANRPGTVSAGNLARLNASGDLEDSGSAASSFADTSHTHNYDNIQNTPTAEVASDGPTDAGTGTNVSSLSAASGADQIDRAAFNTALGTLVSEINAINGILNLLVTSHNTLISAHNDVIDKLQDAGLMDA